MAVLASWWLSYWSEQQASPHPGSPWFYLAIYVVINTAVVAVALFKEVQSINALLKGELR